MIPVVSAVASAALVCASPLVVRRLLAAGGDGDTEAGSVVAGEESPVAYADVVAARWFLPVGVLASAGAAATLALGVGPHPLLLVLVPLVPVGYALAVVDARTRRLPRRVVVAATCAAAAGFITEWAVTGDLGVLARAGGGLLLARTSLWVLWLLGGVGFGDVRLAALTGLVTARIGWSAFVVGLCTALLLATGFALLRAVLTRRSVRGQSIPLGPFLILGAWIGLIGVTA
ncbi:prepilin peptidase [Nocardioides cheoyonin]|uniref:prepilin peptidase n=1 Tax=Nocardioides cheoyonin TaxID=3156615 RepID=UPI0032B53332